MHVRNCDSRLEGRPTLRDWLTKMLGPASRHVGEAGGTLTDFELQTPMGRFGDPDDIAWAAVYLASDEAKFVTGQVLSPNGGWHMSQ